MSTADESRTAQASELAAVPVRRKRTVWRRFRRHRLALFGLVVLVILGLAAIFAPWISFNDPYDVDIFSIRADPTWKHILGTDASGRDVLARLLLAARVSLLVGIGAAVMTKGIAIVLGVFSGHVGGWIDNLIQRFTELVMMVPTFFILIILASIVGGSVWFIIFIIGITGWTSSQRLVRGQVMQLREMDYVTAARAIGAGDMRLMAVHIFPRIVPYMIVAATLTVGGAILSEAGLSFLGFGVGFPTPTWGNMMTSSQSLEILKNMPWLWMPPGIAISATVIAVNFLGDGLRDALDPKQEIH